MKSEIVMTAQERIMCDIAAQHVFDVMAKRVSEEDLCRIKEAYRFAFDAHGTQRRNSGEPYIIHPIAVATIAAEELELDTNTVIAAFLHDVVEDTDRTLEDIRALFGNDAAFLVDAVTKRKKANYEHTKQVDNYKQILDSVHYDIRALLVKLSDRLHNMRTLSSMKPEKQMKTAGETDFFYAPLAGRLGLYHVKSELENLSFRYRCPKDFELIQKQLEEDKERTAERLDRFTAKISEILSAKGIKSRIQVRYRKPYSIWRNMQEENCDFSYVEFKHYVRVIYEPSEGWSEKDTSLYIYSLLSSNFRERPGSVINYIDNPKDNGYQSFHVKLLNQNSGWEELHIASERMHLNSKLGCVVERGESWLERFQKVLQNIADSNDGFMFMEGVSSSLYNEDLIAFTPKGRGIILPKGATALDFAFEVHTDIGEKAQYARINGKLCPIKTELHRGDCVEIGVSNTLKVKPEWIYFVNSYRAKRLIHDLLKNRTILQYKRCDLCLPLPGDEVIGFMDKNSNNNNNNKKNNSRKNNKNDENDVTLHCRYCQEAIKLSSEEGDTIVQVNFEPDINLTYPVRLSIVAIDRYHLLRDIIDCLVEKVKLSMTKLNVVVEDEIVRCCIEVPVHSADELNTAIDSIKAIRGVDEVQVARL